MKDEPFNSTDVRDADLPDRRIVDEFVTSSQAFIWYEHGGRGYHQHLVKYNVLNPGEILHNYRFVETDHTEIWDLIRDREFLESHLAADQEL